jgi:glutathione S-transferase
MPTLRYFDCRSRGQAIRFALTTAGVGFEDERVPVEELRAFHERANEPEVGGPFGSLPVLDWNGDVVAQTLAVAGYLAARLDTGHAELPLASRALRDMVCNAAHLDMQVPYTGLFWRPPDDRDAIRASAEGLLRHLLTKASLLERLHRERCGDAIYFGGTAPSVADAFVHESLDRARMIFGGAFSMEETPRMQALDAAYAAQPAIASLHAEGRVPEVVTASPNERAIQQVVRERFA